MLSELAAWDPINNTTQRKKRFIPLFASIGAAIGSIVNAGQIKKIKKNIAILQEATILQDQQIMELARYADLTAARVRLHDTQIYRLQYGLLVVEDGIREMIDVSNFQVYTSYHVAIAQTILSRLQTGSVSIENNIDKIFEYLRIMSNRKATSAVIPPVALRRLLLRIEDRMRANPRLRLPYDPRAGEIWKYYGVTKVTPIVMDKMLVILMTIPVLDKTLELNIYQVHNLPAIPPGQEIESLYQLENKYFAIGRHGLYVTLPTEQSVRICLQTELAICILEQALYPVEHVTWCVYALFIDDEPRIRRDCKYTVSKVSGNRAISLGGYLWAVSSIKQEQLQVRCLEETHMIEIQPPLQIVYLGNGCEGYSPSMFLPAKNEMTTHAQIESRREYFLQFNYVYTPDRYIGLWWQFRTRMMSEKEARAFITQVAPLGTMDYSLLHKRPPMIKTNYGFSWPVPPATLVIGIVVIVLLIAGVALGCYVYRMGKTFSLATGTIKKISDKPLSGCRRLFSRMHKRTRPVTSPRTTPRQRIIKDMPEAHAAEIHPVQMTKILRDVFQDPQLAHKYAKHLDKKVQVDSFVSQEPEIVPNARKLHRHSVLETYFQKLSERAVSPHRATPGSVGYDLFTPVDFQIQPKEQKTVFIDLAIVPPEGYYAQLMSKSGLTVLYELEVKAGVIDPDFTGNVGVVLKNNSDQLIECLAGEQIAQLLFIKVATPTLIQVTSLAKTERGEYGFGAHTN